MAKFEFVSDKILSSAIKLYRQRYKIISSAIKFHHLRYSDKIPSSAIKLYIVSDEISSSAILIKQLQIHSGKRNIPASEGSFTGTEACLGAGVY